MNRAVVVAAACAAPVLALSACSSSSTATHSAGPLPSRAARSVASSAQPGVSSTPELGSGGGGSASGFCAEVRKQAKILAIGNFDVNHVDRGAYTAELDRIVAVAPGAVKADVQAIEAVQLDAIQGHFDPKKLDSPSLVQHTQHLATWMQTNCPGVLGSTTG